MKSWLQENDLEIFLTHNKGTLVVAKRFITTLKKKNYKSITSSSKSIYIDNLDDIVSGYNNTYHSTIKPKWIRLWGYENSFNGWLIKKILLNKMI